ncbi:hypothetical protein [Winogradskyella immobilis]|uniref:Glycine dehydrogenase n=1 Tax=Winogradskyella immobilis TaxID=2816852 RepID=A0ABS8ENL9_9FLAO|nr:hypothetical protein [Winogradskyella immobilis]MCC1484738.1 hypothetical protein [Winogradskyella immobilis]MCG0016830.1 hypothetical protein [Winogradskyella immobilis]
MSNIKLECHEANHICDKNQYKEASFLEKVKLTIHLIYCRACRQYTRKNTKLTKLVNNPKVQALDATAKEDLQNVFERELVKQQQDH